MGHVDLTCHLDGGSETQGLAGLRMGLSVGIQAGSYNGPRRVMAPPAAEPPVPGTVDLGPVMLHPVTEAS